MDYIPVYEGEEQDDGKTVRVSVGRFSAVACEPKSLRQERSSGLFGPSVR